MSIKNVILILSIIGASSFLFNILRIALSLWTTIGIKVCFYICFFIISIFYLFLSLLPLYFHGCENKYINQVKKFYIYYLYFFFVFSFIEFITLSVNISKYDKYLKVCPFSLSNLSYGSKLKRRCELYNNNTNSRYSYQYICSYDPSKNLKNNFTSKIYPNQAICIEAKKINDNNEILKLFNEEYKDKKKYYCSRTNLPNMTDFNFINPKYCNNISKYSGTIIFYIFSIIQIFIFCFVFINIEVVFNSYIQRTAILNLNNINRINRIIRAEVNNQRLIFFGRILDILVDLIRRENSNSRDSTKISEHQEEENNNNEINKTKNIIIENKEEFSIETNIKNLSQLKENKIDNQVNLDQIQLSFAINSEENKINNNENKNIVNNK